MPFMQAFRHCMHVMHLPVDFTNLLFMMPAVPVMPAVESNWVRQTLIFPPDAAHCGRLLLSAVVMQPTALSCRT